MKDVDTKSVDTDCVEPRHCFCVHAVSSQSVLHFTSLLRCDETLQTLFLIKHMKSHTHHTLSSQFDVKTFTVRLSV